ncbi:hypothetical protein C7999DRAFT_37170 [Corynascus novoguineensis]|uniref:ORC1/DEAH AAA+ ATPase domain-containing protein n=1 Tax=Corynascus novoguineensis TaxID=1126955 RepID=A0AAN7HV04_9PEZI|nr:hypothetical protein C7999DRAFT_37170 [Corynascus novoguineensis]
MKSRRLRQSAVFALQLALLIKTISDHKLLLVTSKIITMRVERRVADGMCIVEAIVAKTGRCDMVLMTVVCPEELVSGRTRIPPAAAGENLRSAVQASRFHDPFRTRQGGYEHLSYRLFPFARNEDVVDRLALFAQLDQLLPPSSASQSAALWGLGGSGKTQIALEYAYRRADEDPTCSVFWVHADDETTFVSDYKAIAKSLKISSDFEGDELLTAVRDGIEALKPYVLVLDNADNLTLFGVGRDRAAGGENTAKEMARNMFGFVPRHSGTVLWTSRDKRIGGSLVSAKRTINVARMTDSEALVLLETVGNKKIGEGELNDAARLLAELDWLPLAVSQAAAYIRRMSITPTEYLSKLARHRKRRKLLGESEFDRHRRPGLSNSIFETWNISMEQIRRENEMAYNILHVLAFLDSQNIPIEIMTKAAALLNKKITDDKQGGESTKSVNSGSDSEDDDDDEVLHAAIRLQEFSFLRFRASEGTNRTYEMHKLVQEATQYALSRRDRRKDETHFSKLALLVVTDLFPERRRELWGECEKYVVHAQRAAEWAEVCEGEIEASDLLSRVAGYMYDRGRWREKEPVDKRAYEFRRKRLGGKHPSTIWSMASLATTYHARGRYEEAENIKVEVLALWRELLGEKHPNTIRSMAELATTYYAQGRWEEAEKIHLETLAVWREVHGEKHPNTIWTMASLATTYQAQGRREEAEKIQVEVLPLLREVRGEKHPNTIWTMASLATIYQAQGRWEEAEKIQVEVLPLLREVLGEKHPNTIWTMASLATTYQAQGRWEEAEKIQVELLALRHEVLGEKHPDTLQAMALLAMTYHAQGRWEEAEKIQVEVLALLREVRGEKHPDMVLTMASLAATYQAQGRRNSSQNPVNFTRHEHMGSG